MNKFIGLVMAYFGYYTRRDVIEEIMACEDLDVVRYIKSKKGGFGAWTDTTTKKAMALLEKKNDKNPT